MHSAQRPRTSQAWKTGFTTPTHYLNYAYKQVPQVVEQPAPGLSRGLLRTMLLLSLVPALLLAYYLFGESPVLHKVYTTLFGR
jgi:hypothetical protein